MFIYSRTFARTSYQNGRALRAGRAIIGWELFGPPRHQELIAQGEAQTFEDAKAAAERAFDKL